ncbi:MAG: type II secretion system F family protein [Chloroflexia bacterium]
MASLVALWVLATVALAAFLYAIYYAFAGSQARVRARVKSFVISPDHEALDAADSRARQRENLFTELDSRWEDRSLFKTLSEDLQAADLHFTPTELLLTEVVVGLGLGFLAWYFIPTFGLFMVPPALALGMYGVQLYIRHLGRRRVQRFEDQLPTNLQILAGSVRGGFSLFQALQLIAKEADEPSKTEFTRVIQEISLGNTMAAALDGLSKRIPTEDVDILTTAITMQQTTGGNLTHVLEVVASTIRERHRVKRDIKTLTAQQRFSAILLAALPFTLAAVLYVISPQYLGQMFQPGWVLCMPIGAVVLSVIGFMVMRRLADIDV